MERSRRLTWARRCARFCAQCSNSAACPVRFFSTQDKQCNEESQNKGAEGAVCWLHCWLGGSGVAPRGGAPVDTLALHSARNRFHDSIAVKEKHLESLNGKLDAVVQLVSELSGKFLRDGARRGATGRTATQRTL